MEPYLTRREESVKANANQRMERADNALSAFVLPWFAARSCAGYSRSRNARKQIQFPVAFRDCKEFGAL